MKSSTKYLANSDIIIWDNSPESQSYDNIEKYLNILYEHHPENLPLSKVYNKVIARNKNKDLDFLILFDQDSNFSENFFIELQKSYLKNNGIKLFLPVVKFKNKIVSPTKKYFLKGFYFSKKPRGLIKAKNISAINSGMIISFNYLRNKFQGYDERLKFYGTDDYFMMQYCNNENELYILDYEFEHDLTLSTLNQSSDKLIQSYHQMLDAWSVLYSNSLLRCIVKIYIVIHSFYTTIKYKDKDFLIWKK